MVLPAVLAIIDLIELGDKWFELRLKRFGTHLCETTIVRDEQLLLFFFLKFEPRIKIWHHQFNTTLALTPTETQ